MGKRRKTTKEARVGLYAASEYLGTSTEQELGLQIPFDVYLQDPWVAKTDPKFGFDKQFQVRWEPGITHGPTSARFVVVDYIGDEERIVPKAQWDETREAFLDPDGKALNSRNVEPLQFHQVNVWALLQRALAFFEGGNGLGRPIPFGFEGNRLIVVPHAGYGQNAFYDRTSKSLQFYYFDHEDNRVGLHVPFGGYRQPRIRTRCPRWHPAVSLRKQPRRDWRVPRVHRRLDRDPDLASQQRLPQKNREDNRRQSCRGGASLQHR